MNQFKEFARVHAVEYAMLDSLSQSVDELYEIADAPGQDYARAVACAAVGSAFMAAAQSLDDELSALVLNWFREPIL